jgi:BASS family bile acid:Na+ symporter
MIVDWLIGVALFLIMFTIGLSIDIPDLIRIFKRPKKVFVGLISQLAFLPIIAFIIVQFFDLPISIKLGILILAICPGGTTSNFISYLVRVNTPLSVALTSIGSLLTLITIPLLANLFLNYYLGNGQSIPLPVLKTILNLLILILIPVSIGMFLRHKKEPFSLKLEKKMRYISVILLAFVFLIKFLASESAGGSGITLESALPILPALLILHFVSLFGGLLIARLFKISMRSSATIGIEVGLQNSALALFITGTLLKDSLMTQPILVYVLFSFFTTALFGIFMKEIVMKKDIRKFKNIKEDFHKSKDFYMANTP